MQDPWSSYISPSMRNVSPRELLLEALTNESKAVLVFELWRLAINSAIFPILIRLVKSRPYFATNNPSSIYLCKWDDLSLLPLPPNGVHNCDPMGGPS